MKVIYHPTHDHHGDSNYQDKYIYYKPLVRCVIQITSIKQIQVDKWHQLKECLLSINYTKAKPFVL